METAIHKWDVHNDYKGLFIVVTANRLHSSFMLLSVKCLVETSSHNG